MGNLRDRYTDEEWKELLGSINKQPLVFVPNRKDYIITEHLGSAFGKVKIHRLIQTTKEYKEGFLEGIKTKSKGEVFCEEIV